MKKLAIPAALAAAFLAGCDEVKVSDFGFDPEDSTEIIQKALDSGAERIVFDRQSGPWVTRPLAARSNQELVFEEGVELVAKRGEFKNKYEPLLYVGGVTNVAIRGRGKGATFRMWKEDYQDAAKYEKSEWRHTLRLTGAVNVLIENMRFVRSGGDGICLGQRQGVACQNVTIRNCVCDDNHRQGISACAFDGLVIEDCVLSNTRGTAPQAGIDIEPNNENEPIRNLVMRNVRSFGNAGSGFEVMLHHMTRKSQPVNLLFENCRACSNRTGTVVVGNHVRETNLVSGDVTFVNSTFEEDLTRGIRVTGVPKGTLNVRFDNCTVVGNPASKATDVAITSLGALQGHPDHVEFNGLKVAKRNGADWFGYEGCGVGPGPTAIRGTVEVCRTNGAVERVTLDEKWAAGRFPLVNGGKPVVPMGPLPEFRQVKAVDAKPGEMVDLAPVGLSSYGRNYLLLVAKPCTVRLWARQSGAKKGDTPGKAKICRILPDGKRPSIATVPMPGPEGGEITFTVRHCPSFYTLALPSAGSASWVEKSNVPIAIDLTGWSPTLVARDGKPFALWASVPGGRPFDVYAYSNSWSPFRATVRDPTGRVFHSDDSRKTGVVLADVPAEKADEGLWSIDFEGVSKQTRLSRFRVATGGLPGVYFLSSEKYWK